MFVILKIQNQVHEVLKIHLNDRESLDKWIDNIIQLEIESLTMCPVQKNISFVSYKVEKNDHVYSLIKQFKKIHRGYVYNSSELISQPIFDIKIIECQDTLFSNELDTTHKADFWFTYNNDINTTVIKQLDRESLYNVITHFLQLIDQKPKKIKEECINMISNSLRITKRDLYNSTVKRVKRMGRFMNHTKDE